MVNVTGSHRAAGCCPIWGQADQFHNQLTVIRELPVPIPMRGYQKLWTITPERWRGETA